MPDISDAFNAPGFESPEFAMWQAARDGFSQELLRPLDERETILAAEVYASGDSAAIAHYEKSKEIAERLPGITKHFRDTHPEPSEAEQLVLDYQEFVRQLQAVEQSKATELSPAEAYEALYGHKPGMLGIMLMSMNFEADDS